MSQNYILAPQIVTASFSVEPAYNVLESLMLLGEADRLSGFSEWIYRTAAGQSPERARNTKLICLGMEILFHDVLPPTDDCPDFVRYIDYLKRQDPVSVRDAFVDYLIRIPSLFPELWKSDLVVQSPEMLLTDRDTFAVYMQAVSETYTPPLFDDEWMLVELFDLLNDPARMIDVTVAHLRVIWHEVLAAEWGRVQPMLQECVAAFQMQDYSGMDVHEVVRAVTGRDVSGMHLNWFNGVEHIVFVPSAHIGPYLAKLRGGKVARLVFGARLPRGMQASSSALTRSELLVRLSALSDDTRLRILELLTKHDELCAQDIIEAVGLSQSSVSRHLKELSATGYITERRKDVSKCYSLNPDRVVDTLRALTNFLSRQ